CSGSSVRRPTSRGRRYESLSESRMRQIRTSGSMRGRWRRGTEGYSGTGNRKGREHARPLLNYRATSLLYIPTRSGVGRGPRVARQGTGRRKEGGAATARRRPVISFTVRSGGSQITGLAAAEVGGKGARTAPPRSERFWGAAQRLT